MNLLLLLWPYRRCLPSSMQIFIVSLERKSAAVDREITIPRTLNLPTVLLWGRRPANLNKRLAHRKAATKAHQLIIKI